MSTKWCVMFYAAINGVRPGIMFGRGLTTVATDEERLEELHTFRWDDLYEYAMAKKRERLLFCFRVVAERRMPTPIRMRTSFRVIAYNTRASCIESFVLNSCISPVLSILCIQRHDI